MSYPKFLYHETEEPRIVNDPAEHEALGEGWEETPAAFDRAEPDAGDEEAPTPKTKKAKK